MKNKINNDCTFFIHSLIIVMLAIFSYSSNCFSSITNHPLSYTSMLYASAQKMTTTSLVDPYSLPSDPQNHPIQAAVLANKFIIYENPRYGITIRYPSNWEKIEYPRLALEVVGSDLVVNFLAPLVNASDHWREHLTIQVLKPTQAKKLIPEGIITLNGIQGYIRVDNSTMKISNLDSNTEIRLHLKTLEAWVPIANGDTYLLTYKAVVARYSNYLPTIQQMLSSFKIAISNNYTK